MATAVVLTLLAAGFAYWLSAGSRSVTAALRAINYNETIATVDGLYRDHLPEPRIISQMPSSAALDRISPNVRFTEEGVYLPTHNRFVEEDGLFILRTGTTFNPTASGEPRFKPVRERLFRYHISG